MPKLISKEVPMVCITLKGGRKGSVNNLVLRLRKFMFKNHIHSTIVSPKYLLRGPISVFIFEKDMKKVKRWFSSQGEKTK